MKTKKLQDLSLRIAPILAAWLLRLWFGTCRVREHGSHHRKKLVKHRRAAIATFWHYSLFYVFYHLMNDSGAILVSASKDGEYVARLARHLNFTTIRGSRNRRGMQAFKEIVVWLKQGKHIGIVADGSQGPARVAQAGVIMLASRTGSPILPMAWSASDYIRFKSWDRTAVPKPFSKIDFHYGEPLWIPPRLRFPALERYRLALEASLNVVYDCAWSQHGRKSH